MTYSDIILTLTNNLLIHFDEVYHSAEIIVNDQNIKQPAIARGAEWISLAPSDTKETVYIRRAGDDDVMEELTLGSCIKSYKMRTPLRIVFFKDHADEHNEILSRLMQSVLIKYTKLNSIIRDKWKLQRDESSGAYKFGATTAYFALDIYAIWEMIPDSCDEDFCTVLENPLKKCS